MIFLVIFASFKNLLGSLLKVAFFQKVRFVFQISQSPKKIIPKNYPELEIWIPKLFNEMGGNFKFQARDSFLEIFFWEIWKTNLTFWKKAPLVSVNPRL